MEAVVLPSGLGLKMGYLEEGAERLLKGWSSTFSARGKGKKLKEAMEAAHYGIWKARPEVVEDPQVIVVASVSPSADNAIDLYAAFRELKERGILDPRDRVVADSYVKALPPVLRKLGVDFEFNEEPKGGFLECFEAALENYRKAAEGYVNPKSQCHNGELKDCAAAVVANTEVRLRHSLTPPAAKGGRVYQVMEFVNLLIGGVSKPNKDSVFEDMREKREPVLFRELEEAGRTYAAFMPLKVEGAGQFDATLYRLGGSR